MRALAVWPARREAGLVEHPEPALDSPSEVRFRTLEVGVCGTDVEICAHFQGVPPEGSDYLVPGHEALGVVEEVGPGVSRLRPGDLVVPSVRRPCPSPECPACRSGHQDFCATGLFRERGIRRAHGFLAERVVEREEHLYRVPPALREVGVLVEPLTIAEKGLRQYLAVQRRLPWMRDLAEVELLAGRRAVVLGAGPVGVLACMLLRHRGCHVWVYSLEERDHPKAAVVEALGGAYVSSRETPFAALAAEIGGIELVFEATGAADLLFQVLGHLGRNAVMVSAGVFGAGRSLEIPAGSLLTRMVVENQLLVGTVNAGDADFHAAIRDLEGCFLARPEALRRVVTGRHSLEEFTACVGARGGIKEIVVLGEG